MHLDEDIGHLRTLDALRSEFSSLITSADNGIQSFVEQAAHIIDSSPNSIDDPLEYVLLGLATVASDQPNPTLPDNTLSYLDTLPATAFNGSITSPIDHSSSPHTLPFLLSARTLQLACSVSQPTFRPSVVRSLHSVVQELFRSEHPEWLVGGARAYPGGSSSAYVTGVSTRSLKMLSNTLSSTGAALQLACQFIERTLSLSILHQTQTAPSTWIHTELVRRIHGFKTAMHSHANDILFTLPSWPSSYDTPSTNDTVTLIQDSFSWFFDFLAALRHSADTSCAVFSELISETTGQHFPDETTDRLFTLPRTAVWAAVGPEAPSSIAAHDSRTCRHALGLTISRDAPDFAAAAGSSVLKHGWFTSRLTYLVTRHAIQSLSTFRPPTCSTFLSSLNISDSASAAAHDAPVSIFREHLRHLYTLVDVFQEQSDRVIKLLTPSLAFLDSVVSRQLYHGETVASANWSPDELVFSVAAFDALSTGRPKDPRVVASIKLFSDSRLRNHLSRSSTVIRHDDRGYSITVSPSEVFRSFARLLHHNPALTDTATLQSILEFFQSTRSRVAPNACGWGIGTAPHLFTAPSPRIWCSALAFLALQRISRALSHVINERIYAHFSVVRPSHLSVPRLRSLFYPDYILSSLPAAGSTSNLPPRIASVGILLEGMHAHLLGSSLPETALPDGPPYSAVFHGPPGTGKTTLLESVALSSNTPLIELTPSDLVESGSEGLERRARLVFESLRMLSNTVIIFDEFDPALRRRNPEEPTSAFSFLTPGLLPKLKRLHDSARDSRVCYALMTNLVGSLDEAAIREGRFDHKLSIHPPDALSRFGRIMFKLAHYSCLGDARSSIATFCARIADDNFKKRLLEAVNLSSGAAMSQAGKHFSLRYLALNTCDIKPGSVLDYVWNFEIYEDAIDISEPIGPIIASYSANPRSKFEERERDELLHIEEADKIVERYLRLIKDSPDIEQDGVLNGFWQWVTRFGGSPNGESN